MSCAAFQDVIPDRSKDTIAAITRVRSLATLGADWMHEPSPGTASKIHFIRFTVWAEAAGYLIFGAIASYIATGSPMSRLTLGDWLWPPLALVAMYGLKLDRRIAIVGPLGLFAFLALLPAAAATTAALVVLYNLFLSPSHDYSVEVPTFTAWWVFLFLYYLMVLVITILLARNAFLQSREPFPRGDA